MSVRTCTSVLFAGYGDRNSTLNVTGLAAARLVEALNENSDAVTFVADNDAWGGDPSPNNQKYFYVVWQERDGDLRSAVVTEYDSRGVVVPTGL
jgi:hypothetical protein